jgi:inner membrane protein
MEPVEHFLLGAALSRAGLNRTTGLATLVMVLAAEAADLDVLYGIRGPAEALQHHRGWTHSLIGTPIVALATLAFVWAIRKLWRRPTKIPIRWGLLFLLGWLAALSHIALDWTNNYGVRPFWPFSPKWYEGDLVFILEPLMLAVLALALIVPWLLGMADREIGAKSVTFRGQRWAWFALTFIALMITVRAVEHHRALSLVAQQQWQAGTPLRANLSPYPITPFQWHAVIDTGDKYQTARVNTWTGNVATDPETDIFYKQPVTPAIAAAEGTRLGRAYMDWARDPLVTAQESSEQDDSAVRRGQITQVDFRDLRFDYQIFGIGGGRNGKAALSAEVLLGPDNSVLEMQMDNRVER